MQNRVLEPKLDFIPQELVSLKDYEEFAKSRVDDNAWAYISGFAADEITAKTNKKAFENISLLGRSLEDVKGGNTKLNLFGQEYDNPIIIAPVAYQKLAHDLGEIATAQASKAMGSCMVVSGFSSTTLEEISNYADNLWFQLYMQYDMKDNLFLIKKAEDLNYKALVITIDAPISGVRNKEQKAGFYLPNGIKAVNIKGLKQANIQIKDNQSMVFDGIMATSGGSKNRLSSSFNKTLSFPAVAFPMIAAGIPAFFSSFTSRLPSAAAISIEPLEISSYGLIPKNSQISIVS